MDLLFEPDNGMPFWLQVDYFDTIQEIKEKVTKFQGIPVHKQTLKFNGKILPDDLDILSSDIPDCSSVQIITATATATDPQPLPPPLTEPITPSPPYCSSSSNKIKILLKPLGVVAEMDMNDSVLKLKEKINETQLETLPTNRIVVHANGMELHDYNTLYEGWLVDGSEVEITLMPPVPPPPPPPPPLTKPDPPLPPSCFLSYRIRIVLKTLGEVMEMDMNDSVLKLKEMIHRTHPGFIPVSRIAVYANGMELSDQHTLSECKLVDGSEVEIAPKPPMPPPMLPPTPPPMLPPMPLPIPPPIPPPPMPLPMPPPPMPQPMQPPPMPPLPMPPPPTRKRPKPSPKKTTESTKTTTNFVDLVGSHGPKKLKVKVVSRCGKFEIELEVNPVSKVAKLKEKIEKAKKEGAVFPLPEEGYFFIHKQDVMEEHESFRWHGVEQDDIIDVFNGYITYGTSTTNRF